MMAWAGSEFPARPGEQVVPNEIVVRLRPGAVAAALIPNYLPGAQIEALRQEFSLPVEIFNPFQKIAPPVDGPGVDLIEQNAGQLAVAVGLALRSFENL